MRAALWAATGDLRRATRWASSTAQIFAWMIIAVGIGMMIGLRFPFLGAGPMNGIWLAFIGWFLNNAALLSYRQLLARETLQDVRVSKLMLTRFDTASPEMRLDLFIDEVMLPSGQHAFAVMHEGRLVGMICLRDVQKVRVETRREVRVGDVMTPAERLVSVAPDDDAFEALAMLGRHGVNQIPVVERGTLRGLIRREEILNRLALHADAEEERMKPQAS